jgi:hypothetical protein
VGGEIKLEQPAKEVGGGSGVCVPGCVVCIVFLALPHLVEAWELLEEGLEHNLCDLHRKVLKEEELVGWLVHGLWDLR